jgi:predicted TPR repeat methyltransferase
MFKLADDSLWRDRLETIDSHIQGIRLPRGSGDVDQDEEWCEIVVDGQRRRVRFHDYAEVFAIPGLYEELFYENLECCSPSYIVNLLDSVVREYGESPEGFRVLDVGAGNGMVGEELTDLGVESVVGVDIIPEAREAALRDRPEIYHDYCVADLTDLPENQERRLRKSASNCLTTVAALGFGDMPPMAFAKALNLIKTPGWLAFNLKEDFLHEEDSSGFSRLIRRLNRERYIQTLCYRRYQHRISIAGDPLYYVAVIARKIRDLDAELLADLS